MIKSMTGYGKSEIILNNNTQCLIQLKSVNSKTLDINFRVPNYLKTKEIEIKKHITGGCIRGKIEFSIDIDNDKQAAASMINEPVVKEYINQINKLGKVRKGEALRLAMHMPDTTVYKKQNFDESQWEEILKGLDTCIQEFKNFRENEGNSMEKDFIKRLSSIKKLLDEIVQYEDERVEQVKSNLNNALENTKVKHDPNRFEQELIYYLERYDITEEKVRLDSHLKFFKDTLNQESEQGKKLNFILQEMGREINTLGSKANHFKIQKCVVQMKDELEKMKEQVLNVL